MSFVNDGANEKMLSVMLLIVYMFNIIEKKFNSSNLNLLPPKPKLSFRHLKKGIQRFHETFVLASADKAGNNSVVV